MCLMKWNNQFDKSRKLLTTLAFAIWSDGLITSDLVHCVSRETWSYSHSSGSKLDVLTMDHIRDLETWYRHRG